MDDPKRCAGADCNHVHLDLMSGEEALDHTTEGHVVPIALTAKYPAVRDFEWPLCCGNERQGEGKQEEMSSFLVPKNNVSFAAPKPSDFVVSERISRNPGLSAL